MHCDDCDWRQQDAPWWGHQHHHEIQQLKRRMDKMSEQQSHLDADVQALNDGLTAIEAEIAALKAANPGVDFTGLDTAVSRVTADVPAPVDAPPADGSGDGSADAGTPSA